MRRAAAAALVAVCGALPAGCGAGEERPAAAAPPPALPASAVPYLESEARPLTAAALAKETGTPELADRLAELGFAAGSRRYFQGQSTRLQVVDARALRFETGAGAAEFVRYVRGRPSLFLAGGQRPADFESRGRRGVMVTGAPCSCHLATPVLMGVVADGPTVTWLEINGPRASKRALRALTAEAP